MTIVEALVVHPETVAELVDVDVRRPEPLGSLVEGYLFEVTPTTARLGVSVAGWHAYVNEDGVRLGLRPNPRATRLAMMGGWLGQHCLLGTVVFLGDTGLGEGDVPPGFLALGDRMFDRGWYIDRTSAPV